MAWMAMIMLLASRRDLNRPDLAPNAGPTVEANLGHLILFAIFGFLISYDVYHIRGRQHLWIGLMVASLIGLIWGAATESVQFFVPGRVASLMDVLINTLGAVTGGLMAIVFTRVVKVPVRNC